MTDSKKEPMPGDEIPIEGTNFRRLGGIGTELYRKLMRNAGVSEETIEANLAKGTAGSSDENCTD